MSKKDQLLDRMAKMKTNFALWDPKTDKLTPISDKEADHLINIK